MGLRRLRGDDGARNGVAKMMVTTLGTGVARVGVEVRPEKFRRRRDPKLVVAGDLLRERRGEKDERTRTDECIFIDLKWEARARGLTGDEAKTSTVGSNSGELFLSIRDATEREKRGEERGE